MAGQFSLFKTRRADKAGKEEYDTLLADRQKRYRGDRDQAVKSANIAAGYGNSTAQRFMHEAPAGVDKITTGSVPTPTPRPDTKPAKELLEDRATRDRVSAVPIPAKRPSAHPATAPVPATRPGGGVRLGPEDRPLKNKLRRRGQFSLTGK